MNRRTKAILQSWSPSYAARKRLLDRLQFCCGTVSGWVLRIATFCCFGRGVWQSTYTEIYTKWINGREPSHYSKEEFRIINQHLKDNLPPSDALDKLRNFKD